jgi:hypothetical protein
MRFLDRLAFNRLVSIIANFILSLVKILNPKINTPSTPKIDIKPAPIVPRPPRKPKVLPWKKK